MVHRRGAARGRGQLRRRLDLQGARAEALRVVSWPVIAGGVVALNALMLGAWDDMAHFAILTGIVALVEGAVAVTAWLADGRVHAPATEPGAPPGDRFLRRLPLDKRGRPVRVEAQDHYLCVVTSAGQGLILMRLADAEGELDGVEGLRVHRSHWIARAGVTRHVRRDGRDFLAMADGVEVPVSRSYRAAARAAGLF
ncbi:LytTR family DNA-binding domain-containing protein [Oceanicola sp. 22II-s10i]|uniref:LytTR family DNA-binding domain-containing protein n=1 Tax=Oceanicola sp. 22II-s10i TaxID=1317116 RepID=UPI000B521045|nr:LytTR family DNA-binding domain-containing protein [Oceanicola sp. 22II-s10i]